jgi:hypothetical protein
MRGMSLVCASGGDFGREATAMSTPHSVGAEEAVLGSILIDAGAFSRIAPVLLDDDFHIPAHRLIYGAVTAVVRSGVTPDLVTVHEELKRQGKDAEAGNLAHLAHNTPSAVNVEHYAKIVRDRSVARCALGAMDKMASAMANTGNVADLLDDAERAFARLKARCTAGIAGHATLQSIGIADFLALDIPPRKDLLAPIIPEQGLVMVHGWRGTGKTHLSVGIAVAVAGGSNFLRWSAPAAAGVLFIDGEMPAVALQARLAAAIQAAGREPVASLELITPDLNPRCGPLNLATEEGQSAVNVLIRDDTRLIVVDNLSSLVLTGVENDSDSWLPLQTWALRHRAAGRSVLFVHHSGKGGAQRGTSRREDVLDAVVAIRRPGDYRQDQGARFEVHTGNRPGAPGIWR